MAQVSVLLIDDEPLIRKTTKMLLTHSNLDCVIAGSGQEGLELAKQKRPDAIMLDLVMPGMDGWQVLEKLKEDPELKDIPVIVFTAGDPEEVYLKGGAAVCSKPFKVADLLTTLSKVIPADKTD